MFNVLNDIFITLQGMSRILRDPKIPKMGQTLDVPQYIYVTGFAKKGLPHI